MGSREPVELTFESAENIVLRWDSTSSDEAGDRTIFADHHVIDQYLNAVDEIQRSLESGTLTESDNQSKAKTAIRIAMARLEDEFRNLLTAHTSPIETHCLIDPNSSFKRTCSTSELHDQSFVVEKGGEGRTCVSYRLANRICEIDLIPSEVISDLRSIAERMVSAGYLRECAQVIDLTDVELEVVEGRTPLALHLIWIMMTLQSNLDGKSRHYKDPALGYLFMMNNVHYIVQKAKAESNLREMIGDGYLRKLSGKYRQLATSYQRSSWVKVMHCLSRDEGLYGNGSSVFGFGVSKSTAVKERFKSFNLAFEEVHKTQAMWLLPDEKLRRAGAKGDDILIPTYTSFLGRFRSYVESGSRHPESVIKYSVEDIEAAIFNLFVDTSASQQQMLRRR
ncbi:hypothetical protein RHMOL_Rhmol12G0247100 [Rhododendron molle]|uniref:Uncharacterized protein n=1 Tax=Rhododendron molle TaxID=49168 RepID=A0ACC0LN17_RHOML|nr:hypothetical protein RHMOL_Rhmol12G0247100 [Rhododendron molle]